jgi:hypothetical protein
VDAGTSAGADAVLPAARGERCVSCGAAIDAEYCPVCGERRVSARDLSLGGLLREGVRDVFDIDARGYRTFRALVTRPGLLTAEYAAGRRRPWLSPFHVFLIANLIYFLLLAVLPINVLTTPLRSHLDGQPYSDVARDMLRARFAAQDTVDFEAFEARFDFAAQQYAATLVIVLVPVLALLFAVVLARRREPAGKHIVFALHLVAALLLLLPAVAAPLLVMMRVLATDAIDREDVFAALMFVTLVPYMYLSLRRAYRTGRVHAALAAITVFMLLPVVLLGYRFILFILVMRTI